MTEIKEKYLDLACTPEERADDLLGRMSLEEKMGQIVGYFPKCKDDIQKLFEDYPQGAGQVSTLHVRAFESLDEVAEYQIEFQKGVMYLSDHHIPAIFHMEGLSGAFIQGAISFPSGLGKASTWNPELETKIACIVGRQERAVGISHTFAPVLDISRDSRLGRQGETYGEDPTLASAMGVAYIKGLQEESDRLESEAVAKHFLGFHASTAGIHSADSEISERTLREIYGKPFQAAITEAGLNGVMPCYCIINGEPVSASSKIITQLLREEMGFKGLIVSDYGAVSNIHYVQRLCESESEAGLRAMTAGINIELPEKKCYSEELMQQFAQNKADMEILDSAVRRVLTAKFRMGLFEYPYAHTGSKLSQAFNQNDAGKVSLEAARESMILLKNENVLPISEDIKRIAVIGYQASTARIFFGGYTHLSMAEEEMVIDGRMKRQATDTDNTEKAETISGTPVQVDSQEYEDIIRRQKPRVHSLIDEMRIRMSNKEIIYSEGYTYAGNDCSKHEEALQIAKTADMVVVVLGGRYGTSTIATMGEGIDATDIGLPVCQEEFLIKLAGLNKPVVGIHFNGRPISSDAADKYCNAILEAWTPGEMGGIAIVDILSGIYNPGGKLPVTVAHTAGQIPIYYNHPSGSSWHQGESIGFADYVDMSHKPRYCFGHGLSYSTFRFSNLIIRNKKLRSDEKLFLSFEIENSGNYAGDEVVQLYFKDVYASMSRPVRELAGFRRVHLESGEKKTVAFEMKLSQTAFLDSNMEWKVEKGELRIEIGSSSEDIRLSDSIYILDDAIVDGRTRGFYAESKIL